MILLLLKFSNELDNLNLIKITARAKAAEGLGWGTKPKGSGDGSPSGVQGRSPDRGLGDEFPQKLKNF